MIAQNRKKGSSFSVGHYSRPENTIDDRKKLFNMMKLTTGFKL